MRKIFYTLLLFVSFTHANTIEQELYDTLVRWNHANNSKDLRVLSSLYDRRIVYYGTKMRQQKVLQDKKRFLNKYPYFSQTIKHFQYTKLTPRLYKVTFDKFVKFGRNAHPKLFPSYLLIDTSSMMPLITEEGDMISDKKIKSLQTKPFQATHFEPKPIEVKKYKRYFFDKPVTLHGQIQAHSYYNTPNHSNIFNRGKRVTTYVLKLPREIKIIKRNRKDGKRNKSIISDEIELSVQNDKLLKVAMQHNLTVSLTGEFYSQRTRDHGRKLLIKANSLSISSDFN